MFWKRLLLAWTTLLVLALAPTSATARAGVIAKTHVGVIDVAAALCIEAACSASLGEYRENPLAEYDGTSDVPHAAGREGNGRVFWSGGDGAKNAAAAHAQRTGGTTLEQTAVGRRLERADLPWSQAKPQWEAASLNFAEGAKGAVDVFVGRAPRPESIRRTIERPALENNPAVDRIRAHLPVVR